MERAFDSDALFYLALDICRVMFTAIMIIAITGSTSKAFFSLLGSPPAIEPMMRELTARPIQPEVITMPMAVPVTRGKKTPPNPKMDRDTGANATPDRKTKTPTSCADFVPDH